MNKLTNDLTSDLAYDINAEYIPAELIDAVLTPFISGSRNGSRSKSCTPEVIWDGKLIPSMNAMEVKKIYGKEGIPNGLFQTWEGACLLLDEEINNLSYELIYASAVSRNANGELSSEVSEVKPDTKGLYDTVRGHRLLKKEDLY